MFAIQAKYRIFSSLRNISSSIFGSLCYVTNRCLSECVLCFNPLSLAVVLLWRQSVLFWKIAWMTSRGACNAIDDLKSGDVVDNAQNAVDGPKASIDGLNFEMKNVQDFVDAVEKGSSDIMNALLEGVHTLETQADGMMETMKTLFEILLTSSKNSDNATRVAIENVEEFQRLCFTLDYKMGLIRALAPKIESAKELCSILEKELAIVKQKSPSYSGNR